MNVRNIDVPTLRAALWTRRTLRRVHRDLEVNGLRYGSPSPPPALPVHALRGVEAVLRRAPSTCLERALIRQSWHAAHGAPRDVVVAVSGTSVDFAAHAWLDGDPDENAGTFAEILRLEPR